MARYRHANLSETILAGSDHLQWYKNSQVWNGNLYMWYTESGEINLVKLFGNRNIFLV